MSSFPETADSHEGSADQLEASVSVLEDLLKEASNADQGLLFENIFTLRDDLNRAFDYDPQLKTGKGAKMLCARLILIDEERNEVEMPLEDILECKKTVSKFFVQEFIKLFLDKETPDTPVEFPFSFKLLDFIKDQIAQDLEDAIGDYLFTHSEDDYLRPNDGRFLTTIKRFFKSDIFYIQTKDGEVCTLKFLIDKQSYLALEVNKLDSKWS